MSKVAVLGAGAWGTALAIHLARFHQDITLWAHTEVHASLMLQAGCNSQYLPDQAFPSSLSVTSDLQLALVGAEAVLVVVPSHVFAETLVKIVGASTSIKYFAWATKGFDPVSQKLLHQIAEEVLPSEQGYAVLSGPTFAAEVAAGLPTAMVSASKGDDQSRFWAGLFHNGHFRVYEQSDVAGVEIGGAYKNILAIATGISDGLGLGANARAALVSRGMAEVMRFAMAFGAKPETLMGLAGLGDLVLTCTDDLSRNRRFGLALAKSDLNVEAVIDKIGQVVEGVKAVQVVVPIAQRLQLELPIAEQVYAVVTEQISAKDAAESLLSREMRSE